MNSNDSRGPLVPPGAVEEFVETSAGRLRVLRAGAESSTEPPLLLLHGGGTDGAAISWFRLLGPLGRDRQVWAIDLPGFGGSIAVPPVGAPRELARVVAETIEKPDVTPVVVGVSMGGDVALNLALEYPGLVRALVLIAPGGLAARVGNRATHTAAWLLARLPDALLLPAARLANRFVRSAMKATVNDLAVLPDQVVAEFARAAGDPRGALGYLRYNQATLGRRGLSNDLTGRVGEIAVPTLLFHGLDDRLVDPGNSRRAAALMPDARLVLVPDCGHWAQLEAHDRFVVELEAFLDRLPAS